MSEIQFYYILAAVLIVVAISTFISLFFFTAPYGRHARSGWGPLVNSKAGWILMEAPASLMMFFYFFISGRTDNLVLIVFLLIWQTHYFHRAFIYPFSIRSSGKMALSISLSGLAFNLFNTYLQGRWIFTLLPEGTYTLEWFYDPRFIAGVIIFLTGYVINKKADLILRNLRKPGETGYKIPEGWLYDYISSPNYLGEIITWTGWAVLTWSFAGFLFVVLSIANLAPRARSHLKWYRENFDNYPENRKALIPFIY